MQPPGRAAPAGQPRFQKPKSVTPERPSFRQLGEERSKRDAEFPRAAAPGRCGLRTGFVVRLTAFLLLPLSEARTRGGADKVPPF